MLTYDSDEQQERKAPGVIECIFYAALFALIIWLVVKLIRSLHG